MDLREQIQESGAPSASRARLGLLLAPVLAAASLLTLGAGPAVASCPNAQFRVGPSANLPDCRAYEQVSPVDKNGSDILNLFGNQATPSGDGISYVAANPLPDAQGAGPVAHLRSIRGGGGWATRDISPPLPPGDLFSGFNVSRLAVLTPDLSGAVWWTPEDPPTLAGTDPNQLNFYRQLDAPGGPYEPMDVGSAVNFPVVEGAASDLSHVLMETFYAGTPLTPDTPPTLSSADSELYDWSGGAWHLVAILPDGTPADHGASNRSGGNQMSSDGSRIFFVADTSSGSSLNVRIDDSRTVLLSDQATEDSFLGATPDGSRAFYEDRNSELFVVNVDSGQSTDIGPGPADLLGLSNDGSYAYFRTLTQHLELWHDGTLTPIASNLDVPQADVSPNGRYLLFTTRTPLTGYDNTPADPNACLSQGNPAPCTEVYRYDAQTGALDCVSCGPPSGTPPPGDSHLQSTIHSWDNLLPDGNLYQVHNVVDDGRVFFETPNALVPADTNGDNGCARTNTNATFPEYGCQDVYEWDGSPHLISAGQSDAASSFADASASGDDVFFRTRQPLVGGDVDSNTDLYDARVDGGFPGPPPPPPPCTGDACQGTPAGAPSVPVAASVSFFGPGNTTVESAAARARVLTRTVRGNTFLITVRVPRRGRITISGAPIRNVRRSVAKAGTYRLRVSLTPRMRRFLLRRHRLRLRLRVSFAPPGAGAQAATVWVTVRPALRHKHGTRARRATATSRRAGK